MDIEILIRFKQRFDNFNQQHSFVIFQWSTNKNKLSALPESSRNIRLLLRSLMVPVILTSDVLAKVIKKTAVGSKIVDLCAFGDNQIYEELGKVYNKKNMFKGLALPTCISINEICAYNSPQPEDTTAIKEGDLVKIELGAHVDGYPGLVAHSFVVQSNAKEAATGKKADVILAAYKATQAALRVIKPGNTNTQVTEIIQKVSDSYKVNPVEGAISHEIKKHLIDGNKIIINKETFEQRAEEFEFNVHDVFALDIFVSSGEGKLKEVVSF